MTATALFATFLSLTVFVTVTYAAQSTNPKNYTKHFSKQRFLTPRDLHGSYSRFLEVSENTSLCPSIITHNTNGVLYPTGSIHIPLRDISHDGETCDSSGDLVIRFRRKMTSQEIQNEFEITPGRTGINKMVRDVLLALDEFYFGRQTAKRECRFSSLPSNAAFFFTSQDQPFAENVGIPFRRNRKILFIFDKDRVCGFSGSFEQPRSIAIETNPGEVVSMFPTPRSTPFSSEVETSPLKTLGSETPGREMIETKNKKDHFIYGLKTPVPSVQDNEHESTSNSNGSEQHTTKVKTTSMPLPAAQAMPDNKEKTFDAATNHENMKYEENEDNRHMGKLSPSPRYLPEMALNGEMASPLEQNETNKTTSLPLSSPSMKPYYNPKASNSPSDSPNTGTQEVFFPSASPIDTPKPGFSMNHLRLHRDTDISETENVSSMSSPGHEPTEESDDRLQTYSDGQSHINSIMDSTISSEPSPLEVISGDSGSTCFPSFATVMLNNGTRMRMDEISVGLSISVGIGKSSRIIDFSHSDHEAVSTFMHIQTRSGRNLTRTPSHFVYTDRGLILAGQVNAGDYLSLSDGRPTSVVHVHRTLSRGLFNPHTIHGDIVVDGFIVSTYTLAAAPLTAHALLAPFRFLYDFGIRASPVSKFTRKRFVVEAFRALLSYDVFSSVSESPVIQTGRYR